MDLYVFRGPYGLLFNFFDCSAQMFDSGTTLANVPSLTIGGGIIQIESSQGGPLGGFVVHSIRRIPEPATLALLGLGLAGLAFACHRKR